MKILVVGQTPPPFGGQAMMIKTMLDNKYKSIKLYHVRMNFSKEMDERGKFSFYKITHMLSIIFQTYLLRFKYKIDAIYYPPSNAPKISIYKDFVFLLATRFMFKKTIFHFHAAGISEVYQQLRPIEKKLVWMALRKPDLTITLSKFNPFDGEFFKGKLNKVIPYGIPSQNKTEKYGFEKENSSPLTLFFMGLLNATKGEGYTLDALKILNNKGYLVNLSIAGKFESEEYKASFFEKVNQYGLADKVKYLGVVTNESKKEAFLAADIFCFPSYFVSESFGLVLLEAMQYGLPIVATRWRGIQEIVEDGGNGFLVDIKDAVKLAEKLQILIENEELRKQMGKRGLELLNEKYTIEKYLSNLEESFLSI